MPYTWRNKPATNLPVRTFLVEDINNAVNDINARHCPTHYTSFKSSDNTSVRSHNTSVHTNYSNYNNYSDNSNYSNWGDYSNYSNRSGDNSGHKNDNTFYGSQHSSVTVDWNSGGGYMFA